MNKDTPTTPNTLHVNKLLADKPIFEPNLPTQRKLGLTLPNAQKNLTCYVHETSAHLPERTCPNSKHVWTLYCEKCDKVYIVPVGCHQRTCSFCNNQRKKKLVWKYTDCCKDMINPKLFTLTAPWFDNPRRGCLAMRAAFKKLRRRYPFKLLFKKGIYGFHIVPKPGGMWYIHIHALVDTKYVPQAMLAGAWAKCMPGAQVVDIRKAWSPKGGLKYILGYITATKHLSGFESEYNSAMHGARLVSTIGDMGTDPLPAGQFICPHCGAASYGYAHAPAPVLKWHNYVRRLNPRLIQSFIN